MKIAYLVNQYPKVSHSFIRREILALEKLGVEIERYSIRSSLDELVDQSDISEHNRTKFILNQSPFLILFVCFITLLKNPMQWISTILLAIKIGWKSDRGLLRHIYYFIEGCVVSKWCKEDGIEHIHAHFGTNSAALAMFAGKLSEVPYSFTVHGPEEFDKPEFLSLGKKIENATFVVAISSFGRSQLYRQISGELWNKVKVVHCGLEAAFYNSETKPISTENKLVCVGRLCEQKGQLLLIEAAKRLRSDGLNFTLTLAGDGPMRSEVEDLIKKHDLHSIVNITGWISSDEVRNEIVSSRGLVLPSFAEGLPVVIMESMALSRPVITTYIAGIPELVIPEVNGWLIPASDIDQLVSAMKNALNMPAEKINKMGELAKERVVKRHNIDIEAEKLLSFIVNPTSPRINL